MINLITITHNISHIFRRFWMASTLNLAGLCIALTAFFLFCTKIEEQVRYNTCFPDYDKIYRVEMEGTLFSNDSIRIANVFGAMKNLAKQSPHVSDVSIVNIIGLSNSLVDYLTFTSGTKKYECALGDNFAEYLSMFHLNIVDSLKTHKDGDALVPSSFALFKYGTTHCSGKVLSYVLNGQTMKTRIAGVYNDLPHNCCISNAIYLYGESTYADDYSNFNFHVYVKVEDKNNVPDVEKHLLKGYMDFYKEYLSENMLKKNIKVHLQPITQTYFSKVEATTDRGNQYLITILFTSALLFIVITNVNFMNFNLALAPIRIKSINTYRVLGASRKSLITGILLESILISLAAFVLSMIACFALDILLTGDVSPLSHPRIVVYTVILSIIIALVSSAYPAVFATSVTPSLALKGTTGLSKRSLRLRTIRVGFQIVVCAIAFTCTATLILQHIFIFTADYGYSKNSILYENIPMTSQADFSKKLRQSIENIDGVQSVSYSKFPIGTDDRYMMWSGSTLDYKYSFFATIMPVDYNYLTTMGINVIKGRNFRKGDHTQLIVNKAACELYPWFKVGGTLLPYDKEQSITSEIIGVCDNVIFSSMRNDNATSALVFLVCDEDSVNLLQFTNIGLINTLNVRLAEDVDEKIVQEKIDRTYHKLSGKDDSLCPFILQDSFNKLYQDEFIFGLQLGTIAIIYISLTLIGVFCLTMFEGEFRRKEIGIRKVFGSTTMEIVLMFTRKYWSLTLVSFALSIPVSIPTCQLILSSFSIKSPYLWTAYPIALVLLILLVLCTVGVQSWKNAKELPAENIK